MGLLNLYNKIFKKRDWYYSLSINERIKYEESNPNCSLVIERKEIDEEKKRKRKWFEELSDEEKLEYIKSNPESIIAKEEEAKIQHELYMLNKKKELAELKNKVISSYVKTICVKTEYLINKQSDKIINIEIVIWSDRNGIELSKNEIINHLNEIKKIIGLNEIRKLNGVDPIVRLNSTDVSQQDEIYHNSKRMGSFGYTPNPSKIINGFCFDENNLPFTGTLYRPIFNNILDQLKNERLSSDYHPIKKNVNFINGETDIKNAF